MAPVKIQTKLTKEGAIGSNKGKWLARVGDAGRFDPVKPPEAPFISPATRGAVSRSKVQLKFYLTLQGADLTMRPHKPRIAFATIDCAMMIAW
mmetsp:Transcript_22859/g.48166  ORF Transcript_22859/g.48166 Transcript_22859/m.48166 type:complete len:93 (-) Transcript_22859:1772-2050(-)